MSRKLYQKAWRDTRKEGYISGKVCSDCGATTNLEFHHLDPSQKIDEIDWSWSIEKIESEIAKCVILCKECHQKRHGKKELTHGTNHAYKRRGCRCEHCRQAHALAGRIYTASTLGVPVDEIEVRGTRRR